MLGLLLAPALPQKACLILAIMLVLRLPEYNVVSASKINHKILIIQSCDTYSVLIFSEWSEYFLFDCGKRGKDHGVMHYALYTKCLV